MLPPKRKWFQEDRERIYPQLLKSARASWPDIPDDAEFVFTAAQIVVLLNVPEGKLPSSLDDEIGVQFFADGLSPYVDVRVQVGGNCLTWEKIDLMIQRAGCIPMGYGPAFNVVAVGLGDSGSRFGPLEANVVVEKEEVYREGLEGDETGLSDDI